jgi:truncated hemoglobin YjbI
MTGTTTSSEPPVVAPTLYRRVGGDTWFESLTAAFYAAVATDPILRPLYPDDLDAAAERLCGFLIQYWGGPADYRRMSRRLWVFGDGPTGSGIVIICLGCDI